MNRSHAMARRTPSSNGSWKKKLFSRKNRMPLQFRLLQFDNKRYLANSERPCCWSLCTAPKTVRSANAIWKKMFVWFRFEHLNIRNECKIIAISVTKPTVRICRVCRHKSSPFTVRLRYGHTTRKIAAVEKLLTTAHSMTSLNVSFS